MYKKVLRYGAVLLVLILLLTYAGCAGTMNAIENRDMSLTAKMSDTIFLDPKVLTKNPKVYVRVTNTSDFQEINFANVLKDALRAKGYEVVNDPSIAGHIVQANLLYMGHEKKGLTAEGMLLGGYGGALAGSGVGSGWKARSAAGVLGAAAGSIIGGIASSTVHVDTYMGVVDIQIKELAPGGVTGTMKTTAKQGAATKLSAYRNIKSNYQTYRTRIVVEAKQTNINRKEACSAIAHRLAIQIAGLF